ncbi:MAG TPA: thrombospondin type 3 repeat-containing protein [Saprospiraceae bacterium]|nr:OmpA family protein [Saprospiraceae bacterium]HRO07734.1 thrombospondin type 3 repeat-containing protein [Saprospiraceae bacterium]HRP41040.1 thrombospondin type 3 repeat-containing protein [Saprospiraceae bacterium]
MKDWLRLILIFLLPVSVVTAQNPDLKSGIVFKKLFLDYQTANGGSFTNFKDYKHGFEIGYHRMLSDKVALTLPLRYGIVNSHIDSVTLIEKRIASLDAQFQYQFSDLGQNFIPYVVAGAGGVYEKIGEFNFQIPVGLGMYFRASSNAYIQIQSEFRYSFLEKRNNFVHGIGFTYLFGKAPEKQMEEEKPVLDSDGDGVPDELDLCPFAFGLKELNGCPDKDGDGVPDYLDKCPDIAGLKEFSGCPDTDGDGVPDYEDECPKVAGTKANKGCPETPKIMDSDGDGVPDDEDECPKVAGTKANKGCPEAPKVLDTDGDGVPDSEDECPKEKGTIATKGCPDKDGDGVPDHLDKCPDKPGLRIYEGCPDTDGDGIPDHRDKCPTIPGSVANEGCPEIKKEDKKTLEIAMQAVQFQLGSSVLKPESHAVLIQIADIMARYPDFNLHISGHTDNTGNPVLNQSLSEKRAKACYDFLIGKGVSSSRMSHIGYGESRPISSNDNEKGRSLNRRVEFNLIPREQ